MADKYILPPPTTPTARSTHIYASPAIMRRNRSMFHALDIGYLGFKSKGYLSSLNFGNLMSKSKGVTSCALYSTNSLVVGLNLPKV